MENDKRPKWDIGEAIDAAKRTISLSEDHITELDNRLQPDELNQLRANTEELAERRSGQSENLTSQKSKTLGLNEAMDELHDHVVCIRKLVKGCNPTGEISKAYGVGEKITNSVTILVAAGNVMIAAYQKFPEWSKNAGIIEEDITDIARLIKAISDAGNVQNDSLYTRKAKTMDKNVLQRSIEDTVTKISALGMLVFTKKKNMALVSLFEELIPGTSNGKPTPPVPPKV